MRRDMLQKQQLFRVVVLVFSLATGVPAARADSVIVVSASEVGQLPSDGDILTLPIAVNANGGIAAVDLTLSCAGCSDYHIRSVTLNPAFSLVVAEELVSPPDGPAMFYHTCRAQAADTIDLGLGGDGAPIELGVIELEVLSDAAVLAPLSITAKVATIGRNPQPTVVYVTDGTNILNADAAPSDTAQIFFAPPAAELASPATPVEGEAESAQPAEAPAEVAAPILTQQEIDTITSAVQSACAEAELDGAACQALLESVLPTDEP